MELLKTEKVMNDANNLINIDERLIQGKIITIRNTQVND